MEDKIYGQSIKVDPRCSPEDWYLIKEEAGKLIVPKNLEEKAARLFAQGWSDWKGVYGTSDIPGGKGNDPLREAIDKAITELR